MIRVSWQAHFRLIIRRAQKRKMIAKNVNISKISAAAMMPRPSDPIAPAISGSWHLAPASVDAYCSRFAIVTFEGFSVDKGNLEGEVG